MPFSRRGGMAYAIRDSTGWLFTIGFLELTFWKGLLAIIIWPYYIGAALVLDGAPLRPPPPS